MVIKATSPCDVNGRFQRRTKDQHGTSTVRASGDGRRSGRPRLPRVLPVSQHSSTSTGPRASDVSRGCGAVHCAGIHDAAAPVHVAACGLRNPSRSTVCVEQSAAVPDLGIRVPAHARVVQQRSGLLPRRLLRRCRHGDGICFDCTGLCVAGRRRPPSEAAMASFAGRSGAQRWSVHPAARERDSCRFRQELFSGCNSAVWFASRR